MSASKFASIAAVLGGVAWGGAAYLGFTHSAYAPLPYLAGFVLFVLAQAGSGYALVATAPGWLRFVVSVANAILGYLIWTLIVDSMGKSRLTLGGAAVILFVAGSVGLIRGRSLEPQPQYGGHRAAR